MNKRKHGILIAFEGGEGVGKTTQIKHLERWLKKQRIKTLVTRQPGGSHAGNQIRAILLDPKHRNLSSRAEILLYAADRAQHVDEVILPALNRGTVVITDRYSDSSVVYQGVCRGLGIPKIQEINRFATAGLWPDLVFVLDVPVRIASKRMLARKRLDRLEMEKRAFHEKVRRGFLKLSRQNSRYVVIDGTLPSEEVSAQILENLKRPLKRRGLWQ